MSLFGFAITLVVQCVLSADVSEFENIQDAFSFPEGYYPSSYKNHTSIVMCSVWLNSRLRSGATKYNLEGINNEIDFDGNLCTHINYRELKLNKNTNEIEINDNYNFVKIFNPLIVEDFQHLRTLVEISMTSGSTYKKQHNVLSNILSSKEKQNKLITSLKQMIKELKLSGVIFGLKFVFNAQNENFLKFVKELRSSFDKDGLLMLTNIPGISIKDIDKCEGNVQYTSRIFDYIIVMGAKFTFNRHVTTHDSPLYPHYPFLNESIESTIKHLIYTKRVPPEKIILEIPLLGGASVMVNGNHLAKDNFSTKINSSVTLDSLRYYEICEYMLDETKTCQVFWDNISKVPFMITGAKWITFNNPRSIYEKVSFANQLGIGIMTLDNDDDDFKNFCSLGKYPLVNTINYALAKLEKERGSLLCSAFLQAQKMQKTIKQRWELRQPFVALTIRSVFASHRKNFELKCSVDSEAMQVIEWFKIDDHNLTKHIKSGKGSTKTKIQDAIFRQNECLPYNTTISILNIRNVTENSGKYVCALKDDDNKVREEFVFYCEHCTKNHNQMTTQNSWISIYTITVGLIFLALVILSLILYKMFTVFKRIRKSNNGLTTSEIETFRKGKMKETDIQTDAVDGAWADLGADVESMPYDLDCFEVVDDDFLIERRTILGCGEYGIVYKGRVRESVVAIKCTKPRCSKAYTKSLLTEIKILIYLGTHPNIVRLIGAKTNRLIDGIVYIFYEFCRYGDLEKFLRASRESFVSIDIEKIDTANQPKAQNDCITTYNLLKWSGQIVDALYHLQEKLVIHGDLATRNILVFNTDLIKISDFGLSKKRHDYAECMKKKREAFPWRWMAIESLRDLTFSHKSDIWSFGITLWEIFSLAETPYPGMAYTDDFIKQLEEGYQHNKPQHAPSTLFNLMERCWALKPQDRPNIKDIKQILHVMAQTPVCSSDYYSNDENQLSGIIYTTGLEEIHI